MCTSTDLALTDLDRRMKRVERGQKRGEGQRKWFFIALALAIVLLVALGSVVVWVVLSRGESRSYYNDQITRLACGEAQYRPPGDPLGDSLRRQFDCVAYPDRSGNQINPNR